MGSIYSRPDAMLGYTQPLLEQEATLDSALGKFRDGVHTIEAKFTKNGNVVWQKKEIPINEVVAYIDDMKDKYQIVSQRVAQKAHELLPDMVTVFSPFNGAETTNVNAEKTVALDRLPIGTPKEILSLYTNEYARAIYLLDKLDKGHSYTGVIQEIGFVGAALLWDIEDIQKGFVSKVEFLDDIGNSVSNIDETQEYPGIRIQYYTQDGNLRIHEQFKGTYANYPQALNRLSAVDVLFLRGTENLITQEEYFPEYNFYVSILRHKGLVVSDAVLEDLVWNMASIFEHRYKVDLLDGEQYGYAAEDAKVNATPGNAFQGHVNILTKK